MTPHIHTYIGPPGTGKTTTLLNVVDDLFEQRYAPEEIVFVSFTKKAAREATDRAIERFNLGKDRFPHWSTIHSICFQQAGLTKAKVMQRGHYKEVADRSGLLISGNYDVEEPWFMDGYGEGDKLVQLIGIARAKKMPLHDYVESMPYVERLEVHKPKLMYFAEMLDSYKTTLGLYDFADMLSIGVDLPPMRSVKVAIIDEAQDLSPMQWDVIYSLFQNCERWILAGDDDQGIFEWGGADPHRFLRLATANEHTVLGHSYRLPRAVWEHSVNIIERCGTRIEKDWEHNGTEGAVRWMFDIREFALLMREVAKAEHDESYLILARNKKFLTQFDKALRHEGIPFMTRGGRSFNEKILLAIKTFSDIQQGKPVSQFSAQRTYDLLRGNKDIKYGFKQLPAFTPETVDRDWLVTHAGLLVPAEGNWWQYLNIPQDKVSYYRTLRKRGYSTQREPNIRLSTIHSVKGGEADHVIVADGMAGMTARGFDVNPDAEHRVQYVGASRAKKSLTIFHNGGKHCYRHPGSRQRFF